MSTPNTGMTSHHADNLAELLTPRLAEYEVTSVPWGREDGEWVVTIWDNDGTPLLDIFGTNGVYILRKIGRGEELGRTEFPEQIPTLVRAKTPS
jgi:hypothetical protein